MVLSYFLKTGKDFLFLLTFHFIRVNYGSVLSVCFSNNKRCVIVLAKEKKIMLSHEGEDFKRQI